MAEARAQRGQTERRERRRTEGPTDITGLKLPIPDWVYEKYPRTEFKHRWFRADPARMHAKTKQDDWDPVEGVKPVPGATDANGKPVNHVLCIKHLDWWIADRVKLEERRSLIEEQIKQGNVAGQGDDCSGDALSSDISYASGSNRLS